MLTGTRVLALGFALMLFGLAVAARALMFNGIVCTGGAPSICTPIVGDLDAVLLAGLLGAGAPVTIAGLIVMWLPARSGT